jgi:thioredoxin 1
MRELTDSTLQREIVEAGAAALVGVGAGWCPYSRLVRPKLERLRERYGERLLVRGIDVELHPSVVESLGLEYVPAIVLFRGGRPVRRLYGDRHLGEIVAHLERSRILE